MNLQSLFDNERARFVDRLVGVRTRLAAEFADCVAELC